MRNQSPEVSAMLTMFAARAYLLQMYKPETGSTPAWLVEADDILAGGERVARRAAMASQLAESQHLTATNTTK